MHTPWGASQDVQRIADGIVWVSAPGHGGILLDQVRTAAMPDYMRRASFTGASAYEHDADWCMPALVFETEFREYLARVETEDVDAFLAKARETLKHSHPAAYEAFFGVKLASGASHARSQEEFMARHAGDWVVLTAWGSWKEGVPVGMVGVSASLGGKREGDVRRYFLVPQDEYRQRSSFGFVVDTDRHEEVAFVDERFAPLRDGASPGAPRR